MRQELKVKNWQHCLQNWQPNNIVDEKQKNFKKIFFYIMLINLKYRFLTWYNQARTRLKESRQKALYKLIMQANVSTIKRIDNQFIPKELNETRLFAIMRNESLRLPHFITYYKNLGVERFFLIDNNSTDDSVRLALEQENVHVFETKENYQNHWFWMEHLLDTYGKGHWCVVVDIDELFSYPSAEHLSLRNLRAFLESRNKTAIRTFLLDMYSDQSVAASSYRRGVNPLEVVNYFDTDYQKMPFSFPDRPKGKPYTFEIFTGGMRDRVFGKSDPPSILSKVPFFKNTEGTYLSQGMHAINGATLSEVQGVVFHTKFLSDFIREVEEECQREQHYGNAFYYKIFHQKLKETPDIQFYHEGSVKLEGSQQLVELGLMKTTPEFEAFAQSVLAEKTT